MRIGGQINGKCVELTINNCLELGQGRIKRRSNFDGSNFITSTGITREEIEQFFNNPMLSSVINVEWHNTKPIIRLTYVGVKYYFEWETGRWWSSEYDNVYFTSSIRELVWDYIIGDDAHHIKSSFLFKQELIGRLMVL